MDHFKWPRVVTCSQYRINRHLPENPPEAEAAFWEAYNSISAESAEYNPAYASAALHAFAELKGRL
jgi:hypothetical protein